MDPIKLVHLLEALPDAVVRKVEAEATALRQEFEATVDRRVRSVLSDLLGGIDLTRLEAAIAGLAGATVPDPAAAAVPTPPGA